jgi:hypothetical protein
MRLCMMPFSFFASRLGITDLVNQIKICINLIKWFHFEIYIILFLFTPWDKIGGRKSN